MILLNLNRIIPILLLLLLALLPMTPAQQIGSFFTAINYNGALPAGHSDCGGSYCCQPQQSCAWDNGGNVACCATGATCQGSAYQGGGGGAKYDQSQQQGQGQGQWAAGGAGTGGGGQGQGQCNNCAGGGGGGQGQCGNCAGGGGGGGGQGQCGSCAGGGSGCGNCGSGCSPCHDTTTVYPSPAPSSSYVAPVVAPISQVSTYVQLSSLPSTITDTGAPTAVVAGGGVKVTTVVPVDQACGGGGYTTLTQANVGAPVKTVGCYVIFEAGAGRVGGLAQVGSRVWVIGVVWMAWWLVERRR